MSDQVRIQGNRPFMQPGTKVRIKTHLDGWTVKWLTYSALGWTWQSKVFGAGRTVEMMDFVARQCGAVEQC